MPAVLLKVTFNASCPCNEDFFNLSGISSEMVLVLVTQELNVALPKENCYCKVFKLDCSEKKINH